MGGPPVEFRTGLGFFGCPILRAVGEGWVFSGLSSSVLCPFRISYRWPPAGAFLLVFALTHNLKFPILNSPSPDFPTPPPTQPHPTLPAEAGAMSGPPAKSKTQLRSESLERDQPSIGSCKAKGTRLRMGIFATFNFKSTICNLSSSPSAVGATQFSPGRKAWVTERRAAIPLALPHPRKPFVSTPRVLPFALPYNLKF